MLSEQNIEAELSHASPHAVATRAGFACEYAGRHLDGAGVDAAVYEDGRLLAADTRLGQRRGTAGLNPGRVRFEGVSGGCGNECP